MGNGRSAGACLRRARQRREAAIGTLLLLLGIAIATALIARSLRVPYTVGLVLIGAGASLLGLRSPVRLDHALIIDGFLPLLLFEASLQVDLRLLRRPLPAIALLAGPGVLISTLIVAGVLRLALGLPLAHAALFGALISATDPVAVLAIFRRLALPRSLAMLVEGESILNDGVALVLFTVLLPAAAGESINPALVAGRFVFVVAGGIAIGALLGWLAALLEGLTTDRQLEIGISVLLAYVSFEAAQAAGVSGVIACVSAGLVFAQRSKGRMTDESQRAVRDVWEFAAFLANSLLFLLIGLLVSSSDLAASLSAIAWAVAATLLGRVVAVYGLSSTGRWLRLPLLRHHRHLVFWSGLRGALAIALSLSLPASFPERGLFLRLTLGVVLFTLVVQGLTVAPLITLLYPERMRQRWRSTPT